MLQDPKSKLTKGKKVTLEGAIQINLNGKHICQLHPAGQLADLLVPATLRHRLNECVLGGSLDCVTTLYIYLHHDVGGDQGNLMSLTQCFACR